MKGFGDSKDTIGHIWVLPQQPNEQFVRETLTELHIPAMSAYVEDVPDRNANAPECKVFMFDGDIPQTEVIIEDEVNALLTAQRISGFKHHRQLSLIFQANDTAETHRDLKRAAKKGNVKHLLDTKVVERARRSLEAEVSRLKEKFPNFALGRQTRGRLMKTVETLQPVLRNRIRQERVQEGFSRAGYIVNERQEVEVDMLAFKKKFAAFRQYTAQEMAAFDEKILQLEEEVKKQKLSHTSEKLLTTHGMTMIPEHQQLAQDPSKVQLDEKSLSHQRAVITTRYSIDNLTRERQQAEDLREEYAEQKKIDKAAIKQEKKKQKKKKRKVPSVTVASELLDMYKTSKTVKRRKVVTGKFIYHILHIDLFFFYF